MQKALTSRRSFNGPSTGMSTLASTDMVHVSVSQRHWPSIRASRRDSLITSTGQSTWQSTYAEDGAPECYRMAPEATDFIQKLQEMSSRVDWPVDCPQSTGATRQTLQNKTKWSFPRGSFRPFCLPVDVTVDWPGCHVDWLASTVSRRLRRLAISCQSTVWLFGSFS